VCHKFSRSSQELLLVRNKTYEQWSMLQCSWVLFHYAPLFRSDRSGSKLLNRIRPNKIKKYIFNCVLLKKTSVKHYLMTLHKLDEDHLMM
jgi:hypothetical protein